MTSEPGRQSAQDALSLSGRTALVTGGGSGIGLATARVFSSLGARIILCDLDGKALQAAAEELDTLASFQCDISDEAGVAAMVDEAIAGSGAIDILFNSAGVGAPPAPTVDQSIPDWQRILDVNLRGTYLACRAVGAKMLERGSGSIINVASVVGTSVLAQRTAYGASKSGVMWITKSLALEWGAGGVRVNAIAPGYVMSPLLDRVARDGGFDLDRLARRTPIGRIARAEEIGWAAAFLASDLSSYVTGTILPVDGGWTAKAALT